MSAGGAVDVDGIVENVRQVVSLSKITVFVNQSWTVRCGYRELIGPEWQQRVESREAS